MFIHNIRYSAHNSSIWLHMSPTSWSNNKPLLIASLKLAASLPSLPSVATSHFDSRTISACQFGQTAI